jgi:hypothetical protein
MCGVEAGYGHKPECPYPYYGRNQQEEERWLAAMQKLLEHCAAQNAQPTDAREGSAEAEDRPDRD